MRPETAGAPGETIRPFGAADVAFAARETAREGWPTSRAWFEALLEHDPQGSFLLEVDGAPAGMVTTACYANSAWIGNLIVPPAHRRRGFGTRLMMRGLAYIATAGIRTAYLDGDAPGIGIYRRLGFADLFESLRFHLAVPPPPAPTEAVPFSLEHFAALAKLDADTFGDNRTRLLRLLLAHADAAFVLERAEQLVGYVLVMATSSGVHVGPCVAEDLAASAELWRAAIQAAHGRPMSTGLASNNAAGIELLRTLGFVATPSSLRMVRGPVPSSGRPQQLFAIGSGAFG